MIIVIDGPAGSGKSSTAKAVAKRAELHYLDSGAFYRVVTLVYIEHQCNVELFFDSLKTIDLSFRYERGVFRVFLEGLEVTDRIRTAEVSSKVSEVAAMEQARDFVNVLLRKFVETGNFIADGRDLGTVVFPNADIKFFLVADFHERAKRRLAEMEQSDLEADFDEILENLAHRDKKDSSRTIAPLRQAEDAIKIDTSSLSFDEQVNIIIDRIGYR
jgi:cytidylate kinase